MSDILDAVQSNTPTPQSANPVEPPPVPLDPPVTNSDSLMVSPPEKPAPEQITSSDSPPTNDTPPPPPPPEEPKQDEEKLPEKPKKKSRLGVLLAGLLFFFITIPILMVFVKQQVEIRSRAANEICTLPDKCMPYVDCTLTNKGSVLGEYNCSGTNICCRLPNANTPTPKKTSTPTPSCISNGRCLDPGQDCCGNDSYFDNSCAVTETRCGTKSTPTPKKTPTPTPADCKSPNICLSSYICDDSGGTVKPGKCSTGQVCCLIPPTPTPTKTPTCASPNICLSSYICDDSGGTVKPGTCSTAGQVCCLIPSLTPTKTPTPGIPITPPKTCNLPPINYICLNTGAKFKGQCAIYHCPQGCGGGDPAKCGEDDPGVWISHADCSTRLGENECGQIDIVDENLVYCLADGKYCDVPQLRCTNCGGSGPTSTPTPPPGQCINIVAYKNNKALSPSELAALQPGDTITLAFTPGGAAVTKVRFRVNAKKWNETTTKNAKKQFTWKYTLEDITSFTIKAQWFDGKVWH